MDLPDKFTAEEKAAYKWLLDCGISGWAVDFATKRVHQDLPSYRLWQSLIEFAAALGRKP